MAIKYAWVALLLVLCTFAGQLSAQSNCSYVIISTGAYSRQQIDQAFLGANLDSYRKKTVRRPMLFTNGAEVQLYSAAELPTMNCPVNGTLAMEDNEVLDPARRFEIHPSGILFESVQAVFKH